MRATSVKQTNKQKQYGTGIQTYRPVEQNRESRTKPTYIQKTDLQKGYQEQRKEKGQYL